MKTVLITGGAGYIGSHAVKLFLAQGYRVVIFDNLSQGHQQAVDILSGLGEVIFIKGDLRNRADLERAFSKQPIDAVLHFAALCNPNESVAQPGRYFANNVFGSLNLLGAMKEFGVNKIIFSSSCAVYGEARYLPVDEHHLTNPAHPYGESKLMTERMLKWYGETERLRYVILRYFNVCGADRDGLIGDSKQPSVLLVQNAVRGAMGLGEFSYTYQPVETSDGSPVRDYIDVEDLARAHSQALEYLDQGGTNETINLGNGMGWSVKQIVATVEQLLSVSIPKRPGEQRRGEYAEVYADTTRAKKVLAFKPKKNLADSVTSLQRWYEGHPQGYDY